MGWIDGTCTAFRHSAVATAHHRECTGQADDFPASGVLAAYATCQNVRVPVGGDIDEAVAFDQPANVVVQIVVIRPVVIAVVLGSVDAIADEAHQAVHAFDPDDSPQSFRRRENEVLHDGDRQIDVPLAVDIGHGIDVDLIDQHPCRL